MAPVDKLMEHVKIFGGQDPFMSLKGELDEALSLYWRTASQILQGSGISVLEPPPEYCSLKRNFFPLFSCTLISGPVFQNREGFSMRP